MATSASVRTRGTGAQDDGAPAFDIVLCDEARRTTGIDKPGDKTSPFALPVTVPAGTDPARALDDNKRFAAVWGVLRALRSHDDRFDAEINQIDLNTDDQTN